MITTNYDLLVGFTGDKNIIKRDRERIDPWQAKRPHVSTYV